MSRKGGLRLALTVFEGILALIFLAVGSRSGFDPTDSYSTAKERYEYGMRDGYGTAVLQMCAAILGYKCVKSFWKLVHS